MTKKCRLLRCDFLASFRHPPLGFKFFILGLAKKYLFGDFFFLGFWLRQIQGAEISLDLGKSWEMAELSRQDEIAEARATDKRCWAWWDGARST